MEDLDDMEDLDRKKGRGFKKAPNGAPLFCTVNPVMVVRIHPPQPSFARYARYGWQAP